MRIAKEKFKEAVDIVAETIKSEKHARLQEEFIARNIELLKWSTEDTLFDNTVTKIDTVQANGLKIADDAQTNE